jgi:hypothetical protein
MSFNGKPHEGAEGCERAETSIGLNGKVLLLAELTHRTRTRTTLHSPDPFLKQASKRYPHEEEEFTSPTWDHLINHRLY